MINETYETMKGYVITNVLKVAYPYLDWSPEDIVRTHRVGNPNSDADENPCMVLIKFLHWDRKMAVLRGREALREHGIRIGDDITRRQRATLKRLSDEGKSGYYYKGELFVREKNKKPSENLERGSNVIQSRAFVKAFRKTVSIRDMTTALPNTNIDGRVVNNDIRNTNFVMKSTDEEGESDK